MKRWYAVYTKPGQEWVAEANLKNQGFETFCPRMEERRRAKSRSASARPVTAIVPLFARYLFVCLDMESARWRAVNSTIGVIGFVSFGGKPASLGDDAIAEIKDRTDSEGIVRLSSASPFRAGDKLEVVEGPMADVEAICQSADAKERVVVMMNLLNRQVSVTMPSHRLRKAS